MHKTRCLALVLMGLSILSANSFAEKGFTIEGGLLYDQPGGGGHNRPFPAMKGGFGYTANFGYNFTNQEGFELGVMHTMHNYELGVRTNAAIEDNADKTTFFLKARVSPLKRGNFEIVTAAGIGFFDIAGKQIIQEQDTDNDFSGLGFTGNFDFRYYITSGLAVSIYLGANFVDYNRYEIFGYKKDYGMKMPGGNSINWGLTLFHHIGIPQL
jgi:hypothetical protein